MKIKGYIPDFKLAFEHFCIHTGGRGVIEEIEKQLQLAPDNVQPSKDTLFRYGNTSSSSIWSVLSLSIRVALTAVMAARRRPAMECNSHHVSQLAEQRLHVCAVNTCQTLSCQNDYDTIGQELKE